MSAGSDLRETEGIRGLVDQHVPLAELPAPPSELMATAVSEGVDGKSLCASKLGYDISCLQFSSGKGLCSPSDRVTFGSVDVHGQLQTPQLCSDCLR